MLSVLGARLESKRIELVAESMRFPEESTEKVALGEEEGGRVEVEKGEVEKTSK